MMKLKLQYFAEGEGAAAVNTSAGEIGVPAAIAGENGVPATTGETTPIEAPTEESFDDLISRKYKSDFENKLKEKLGERLKKHQAVEEKYKKLEPALLMMARHYGIDTDNFDIDTFVQSVENDNTYYEKKALEQGLPVEAVKKIDQLERKELMRQREERERQEAAQKSARFEKLVRESQKVKEMYPDFNLDSEMQNAAFARLVANNVPVQTAYEVAHKDEIIGKAMQYTAKQTEQKLSKAIQSGMRPIENGTSGNGAVMLNVDPRNLTKEERKRIKDAVRQGKRITL